MSRSVSDGWSFMEHCDPEGLVIRRTAIEVATNLECEGINFQWTLADFKGMRRLAAKGKEVPLRLTRLGSDSEMNSSVLCTQGYADASGRIWWLHIDLFEKTEQWKGCVSLFTHCWKEDADGPPFSVTMRVDLPGSTTALKEVEINGSRGNSNFGVYDLLLPEECESLEAVDLVISIHLQIWGKPVTRVINESHAAGETPPVKRSC